MAGIDIMCRAKYTAFSSLGGRASPYADHSLADDVLGVWSSPFRALWFHMLLIKDWFNDAAPLSGALGLHRSRGNTEQKCQASLKVRNTSPMMASTRFLHQGFEKSGVDIWPETGNATLLSSAKNHLKSTYIL
jgi:hypothetical protein